MHSCSGLKVTPMAAYKDRVEQDLDRWIAAGLVAPEHRAAILATLPQSRRLDAATALAWVGGALLGVAIIAFVAANWEVLPKLVRFALLLLTFLGLAAAGAWAAHRARALTANILVMLAALVFAASIGLTGQIFDIAGNPAAAAHAAGAAALALGMAGRSTGAAIAGLVFVALGDLADGQWFSGIGAEAPWSLFAAPLGAYLALRWSSAPLAHAGALGVIYCFSWFGARMESEAGVFAFLAMVMAGMAAVARWLSAQGRPFASVFYGWFAAAALLFLAIAGYLPWFGGEASVAGAVAHRIVWLAASGALVALGRFDRHTLVSTIGALSLIVAVFALLGDLGLELLSAAAVFFVCAIAALAAGLFLRRKDARP